MDRKVLDAVLNSWKIRDESERWSLISMFVRHHGEDFTHEDFIAFLEKVYQSPVNTGIPRSSLRNYNLASCLEKSFEISKKIS